MNNGSTNASDGAPTAISSLIACEVKLYPSYRRPPSISVAMYSSDERIPHASKACRTLWLLRTGCVLTGPRSRVQAIVIAPSRVTPRAYHAGWRKDHVANGRRLSVGRVRRVGKRLTAAAAAGFLEELLVERGEFKTALWPSGFSGR